MSCVPGVPMGVCVSRVGSVHARCMWVYLVFGVGSVKAWVCRICSRFVSPGQVYLGV